MGIFLKHVIFGFVYNKESVLEERKGKKEKPTLLIKGNFFTTTKRNFAGRNG